MGAGALCGVAGAVLCCWRGRCGRLPTSLAGAILAVPAAAHREMTGAFLGCGQWALPAGSEAL